MFQMEESVVLEEEIDLNYKPSSDELRDYAESLGLVLPEDNDLMYLAKEGIMARLPKEWKPCQTRGDEIYYFNFETGESVWEHPCDTYYKKKVKEAKAAKKNRNDKNKIKPLQSNKKNPTNLVFSPVQEQPENSEFTKRKNEIEEEFQKFSEQIKKEYTEKELEEIKEKLRKVSAEKEEGSLKANKNKLEQMRANIKKQLDKEESDICNKLNKECYEKIEEVKSKYLKLLEDGKNKIIQKTSKENEEILKKLKKNNEFEIENMIKDAEIFKQKYEYELKETENLRQKHQSKIEKIRAELNLELEREKKSIEKDTERQINILRQEENGELSSEDRSLLYNLEKELSSGLNKELQQLKTENAEKMKCEKEKIVDQNKFKSEKIKLESEIKLKEDLYLKESELKIQVSDLINKYQSRKESEYLQYMAEYEQKLKKNIESEEQHHDLRQKLVAGQVEDDRKTVLDSQIRGYQREVANLDHQLYLKNAELSKLKDEEGKIRTELKRTEIETEDLKGKDDIIEAVVIADLEKQLLDKENELLKYDDINFDRISQLEKEVTDLKKNLFKQKGNVLEKEEAEKIRISLAAEKEELKHMQNMLKQDREKWNREMKEYKLNPTEKKRHELYNIKRIIEKNIQKHNMRVKDLKQAEEMLRLGNGTEDASEDEELILEMWRGAEYRPSTVNQYTRQPWQNHNLHVYQRQVNKWCKSREYMKDVMTRHGSWLNNMKEQLNRVMSTPHTIKTFY